MKIDAHPEFVRELEKHAQISLSNNNRRLVSGSTEILVSPTLEGVSDEALREEVLELLSKQSITDTLYNIEEDNLSKLGPRSIAKPWSERKDSLFAYFHGPSMAQEKMDDHCISYEGHGPLRPASLESAYRNLVPSSNSGLPYMVRKSGVSYGCAAEVFNDENEYPCVLFTRTQEQKKTRDIWGFPLKDTLEEARYLIPFIELEKQFPHRAALRGPDYVDTKVTELLRAKSDEEKVVCVDFTSFDASVSGELITHAFAQIAMHFQERYHDEIENITRRFKTIPIYTPDGVIEGPHGVPSGSGFTNTVDSQVQLQAAGPHRAPRCQIQGDDGIYLERSEGVQEFLDSFERSGLRINRDKTRVFDGLEGTYLQRYYHPDYTSGTSLGGVYPISRALGRIKYLERFTDFEKLGIEGRDFFALRTIMILENCKHHPCFHQLVRYVQSQDKYRLNYSDKGLKAFSRAMASKARAGQWISQEDSRAKGLADFATIQALSEA